MSFSAIPAAWIALAVSIIVGALEQIVGSGLVTGTGLNVLNVLIAILPVIGGLFAGRYVTSSGRKLFGVFG